MNLVIHHDQGIELRTTTGISLNHDSGCSALPSGAPQSRLAAQYHCNRGARSSKFYDIEVTKQDEVTWGKGG